MKDVAMERWLLSTASSTYAPPCSAGAMAGSSTASDAGWLSCLVLQALGGAPRLPALAAAERGLGGHLPPAGTLKALRQAGRACRSSSKHTCRLASGGNLFQSGIAFMLHI